MTFVFGQSDMAVLLEPEKPGRGRKPVERRVYSRYGKAKERTVQEICDAAGGDVVYFEADVRGAPVTIPVHTWRRSRYSGTSSMTGWIVHVADFIQACADKGHQVVVYGADRVRWKLTVSNVRQSSARDALDAEPDSAGTPTMPAAGTVAAGTMREEF